MTDGIIKGTGNSRLIKTVANALTLYPTYEKFMEAFIAGTLPIDLFGINPSGWNVQGDKLGKSTLLTDALCTALGLATTATPTQAMEKLRQLVNTAQNVATGRAQVEVGTYVGIGRKTGDSNNPVSLTLSFAPKILWIPCYGPNNIIYNFASFGPFMFSSTLSTEYKTQVGMSTENDKTYSAGKKSSDGKTFYWYYARNNYAADTQLDHSGFTYYYIAIG